jgi:hypothetical protein
MNKLRGLYGYLQYGAILLACVAGIITILQSRQITSLVDYSYQVENAYLGIHQEHAVTVSFLLGFLFSLYRYIECLSSF